MDIAIIGAGAAGLAAAIFCAEAARENAMNAGAPRSVASRNDPPRIVLLDGARTIGAKILVSGGGRCNVTHDVVSPSDFNAPAHFVRHVLAAFDERAAVQWFESMGVRLKREPTGKLFPVTDRARTVLAALLDRCAAVGVDVRSASRVREVRRDNDGFVIAMEQGELRARRVIMATGGRSLPRTGSDGGGWAIVRRLGHTVTPTFPALVPLVLDDAMFHASLSGLSLDVTLSTFTGGGRGTGGAPTGGAPTGGTGGGGRIDQRSGSLLFTHFGVSGPVVMDASRHWVMAHSQAEATMQSPGGRSGSSDSSGGASMRCAFVPDADFQSVERDLLAAAKREPRRTLVKAVAQLVPPRLAEALLRYIDVDAAQPLSQLSRDDRRRVVHALTDFELPIARDRGWNYAEVTAGGVPLSEVHHRDLQSRLVPGLFLIGEMLDCDGRIGGFNFQWAWSTGHVAGREAAKVDTGIGK